jgi:hypothetical protein
VNKTETIKILAVLKAAYPNSYKDEELAVQMVSLWQDMFSDTPAVNVGLAVKALIVTCKFPPTIAEIKDYIQKLTEPERMSGTEAWRMVMKAINGPDVHYTERGWDYTETFNKLPAEVRSIVGSPSQMRIWADCGEHELEQFTQRDFVRGFDARQKATSEFERLPESVRAQSEQIKGIGIDKLLRIAESKRGEGNG